MFQNVGAAAYKEGLGGTLLLDEHFGHPHRSYKTIHVGGTNGKGSVTHTLAAILQAQGYRVGLYTSPHLVDFRERIRVNGKMISKKRVTDFVRELKMENGKLKGNSIFNLQSSIDFSFFELATALAFKYFEEQKVDFAVVEVGLGGRLDCTNIITPVLSVITNISFDHVQFLGDTLPKIASEKAGIIKPGIPVCIGENINEEVKAVFEHKAKEVGAPITFAEDENCKLSTVNGQCSTFNFQLKGLCQQKNQRTILTSVRLLRESGIEISDKAIKKGFEEVCSMTGLMGRWQILSKKPLTICDTGHNVGGMQYIAKQLDEMRNEKLSKGLKAKLHIVFGCCQDKDVSKVLEMLPKDATYYFTKASVERAMPAERLSKIALSIFNIQSSIYNDVEIACKAAQAAAGENDIIFIGGSTFLVADLLRDMKI